MKVEIDPALLVIYLSKLLSLLVLDASETAYVVINLLLTTCY